MSRATQEESQELGRVLVSLYHGQTIETKSLGEYALNFLDSMNNNGKLDVDGDKVKAKPEFITRVRQLRSGERWETR